MSALWYCAYGAILMLAMLLLVGCWITYMIHRSTMYMGRHDDGMKQ